MAGEGIVAAGVCGQGCFPGARGSAPAGLGPSLPGSWDHTSGGAERRGLLVSDRDRQVSVSHGSLGSPRHPQPCVRVRSHPRPQPTAAVEGIRLGRRGLSPRERLRAGAAVARTSCKLRRPRVPAVCAPPRAGSTPTRSSSLVGALLSLRYIPSGATSRRCTCPHH